MVSVFYFGGEHLENLNIKEIIRSKEEKRILKWYYNRHRRWIL